MRKYYKLNQNITAKTVRVLASDGKQIGVLSIREALEEARKAGMDLVEITAQADPPVVKVVDFKKFKYEEAKRERKTRSKTHQIETKEIWLSPTISEHDLNIRVERAKEFLGDGDRVKFTMKFPGRSITHPEFGKQVVSRALESLSGFGEADGEGRMMGRSFIQSIKPAKKQTTNGETKN